MVAVEEKEWIPFDELRSFSHQKKPSVVGRALSLPTDWRTEPIRTGGSVKAIPPPVVVPPSRKHQKKSLPISPKMKLQPVNPSPKRSGWSRADEKSSRTAPADTSSSTLESDVVAGKKNQDTRKQEGLNSRSRTISTSESSSDSEKGHKSTREAKQKTLPALPPPGSNRPLQRGRAASAPRPTRSSSQGASARGRSSSRGRAAGSRSSSRSSRGRSHSRNRPPATRNNSVSRHRSRSRSASRSASLTRVTGPDTTNASRLTTGRRPPPSTLRTRDALRKKTVGSSSSIGPGITPGSKTSDDMSLGTHDDNIGRDISFGHDVDKSMLDKNNVKGRKSGFMEKLFGNFVDKPLSQTVLPGSFQYEIRPRVLLAATVYHNTATNLWITTINTNQRGVARDPKTANRYLKAFSFPTEREARESAIANAPPKMVPFNESPHCFVCKGKFAVFRRASHCRNCGVCICSSCSTSWSAKMIPDTYNLKKEANVKVCLSCNSLSSSFKKALLAGDYEEAVALYGTGNVNLRSPFPVSNKKDEVMHPIHAAVEGGNIDIIRWLIDDHFCPIKLVRTGTGKRGKGADVPISTSKGRSLLSIAIDTVKVDIMRYLVIECGVSIYESVDLNKSLRALEAALIALPANRRERAEPKYELPVSTRWDKASFDDISEPSSLGVDEPLLDENDVGTSSVYSKQSRVTRGSRMGDACIICFDRKIDCCATPCGHQMCCCECSRNLSACPVCNTQGEFIKIFRP